MWALRLEDCQQAWRAGELVEKICVRTLINAVSQLHLIQLRASHVKALKHLEDKVGLALSRDGVHVDGVVLNDFLLNFVQVVEYAPVEFVEHLEAGQFERRAVWEAPLYEAVDGREPLLAVHHLEHAGVRLVKEYGWNGHVEQEALDEPGRRPDAPHVLALVARPEVEFVSRNLVDEAIDGEVALVDAQRAESSRRVVCEVRRRRRRPVRVLDEVDSVCAVQRAFDRRVPSEQLSRFDVPLLRSSLQFKQRLFFAV
mmetsp:Transcript_680/g.1686  ORF Transcript_680/g.1686 Transcript_680/m.1686 type:complete len:256 (+) Transcript_680:1955-2722(+)